MALPTIPVTTLEDLHLLAPVKEPHRIELVAIDAVRRTPLCLVAVEKKQASGWLCTRLPQLRRAKRFADLLAELDGDILVRLMDNDDDRLALRNLRTCGNLMLRLRRGADGQLVDLAGYFSNTLSRATRQALNPGKAYEVSKGWIDRISGLVEQCRATSIVFQEEVAQDADHHGREQSDGLGEAFKGAGNRGKLFKSKGKLKGGKDK